MTQIPESLRSLAVPIGSVRPYPGNPRRGQIDAIKDSLREHGQYRPIVVQRSSGVVLAGNHTWQAAKALGWQQLAVTYIDCDDDEARRIVLVDNRLNELGGYDSQALTELLQEVAVSPRRLSGTGYDDATLTELLADFQPDPEAPQGQLDQAEAHCQSCTCYAGAT